MKPTTLFIPRTTKLEVLYSKAKNTYKGCILCVHGICHGAWCFEHFLDEFSDHGYDCFALSLSGHAGSDGHTTIDNYDLADYSEDIGDCINDLMDRNIMKSKPFLLGHSMGGAIVQKYMGEHSETIHGAILFAPATAPKMGPIERTWPILKKGPINAFRMLRLIRCNKPMPAEAMAKSAFFSGRLPIEEIEYYNQKLQNESWKAIGNLGNLYTNNHTIDIPILVIGSDADEYFGEKSLNKTANYYGCTKTDNQKSLVILPDLCHDMMLDPQWKETANKVLKFMENNK